MSRRKHTSKKPDTPEIVTIRGDRNVVTISGEKEAESKKPTSKFNPIILVALIGFLGTVLAAYISTFGGKKDPPHETASVETPSPIVVTTTPEPTFEPTLTPLPATSTPIPTFNEVIPVPIGEDWPKGCISTLWMPYPSSLVPSERGDGCWDEPVHVFSAENGDLDFLAERKGGIPEIYGLFAQLPNRGTVTFTVRLKDLHNVDLWMGVFAEANLNSDGMLMAILNGDVKRRPIVQKDPHTYDTIQGTVALNQDNGYSISFVFTPLYVHSKVNSNIFATNPVSIPSPKKWLFLGYKGLNGSFRIEGRFLSFEIVQQ